MEEDGIFLPFELGESGVAAALLVSCVTAATTLRLGDVHPQWPKNQLFIEKTHKTMKLGIHYDDDPPH
jgi:hypothetical protein